MALYAIMLWLHFIFATTWIGGMVFNLFALRPSLGAIEARERPKLALAILQRFIPMVWASALGLTISGVLLATASLDSFEGLIAHKYGRILLLRVAVMGLMVFIVEYIRYSRLPLIESLPEPPEIGTLLGRVVAIVKLNLGLGLAVLLLSSMLAYTGGGF